MSALAIQGVTKAFGRAEILRGMDLEVTEGSCHAIIGPNGAGKSTLFNVITGLAPPDAGEIRLHGQLISGLEPHRIARAGLSRSFQITNIFPRLSVFENVRCALLHAGGYGLSFIRHLSRARDLDARVTAVLEDVGLARRAKLPAGVLSYAEQRALEMGITLGCGARVVLLDEPTAGMSNTETRAALDLIKRLGEKCSLVIVEHDMNVVFELADRISVLVNGRVIATGTPAEIRANADVQRAYLGTLAEFER